MSEVCFLHMQVKCPIKSSNVDNFFSFIGEAIDTDYDLYFRK